MEPYPFPTGGVPRLMPAGAVGDVNSTAKGSGARFNSGKAPLDLLPIFVLAASVKPKNGKGETQALYWLGQWQMTGDTSFLMSALQNLGPNIWAEAAHVFDYGRKKYAEWNWAKGMAWSIPVGCAARHLMAAINGEETDSESGLSHLAHAACNIIMLLTYETTFPEGDDRPRYLEDAHG